MGDTLHELVEAMRVALARYRAAHQKRWAKKGHHPDNIPALADADQALASARQALDNFLVPPPVVTEDEETE